MSFNAGGGGSSSIGGSSDVALSNPANSETLLYNSGIGKWQNGAVTVADNSITEAKLDATARNKLDGAATQTDLTAETTARGAADDLRPARLYYTSGAYPNRPASGYVEFVGPTSPGAALLDGDTWIDTTPALTQYRKRKSTDATAITSNTTAASDSDLSGFAIAANEIIEIDLLIRYSTPDTADLKVVLVGPSGCTIYLSQKALSTAAVGTATTSSINYVEVTPGGTAATTAGGSTASGSLYAWYHGTLANGSTSGTLSVQFAQGTADAGNTIVKAGSRLIISREF